ncbi:MAG: ABC transporter substrate-binding protein [Alphaproteobacteria bacterium]|nr:ABC transporter substrate-binding protein [Alphaproteobacteria bacterium]
MKKLLAFAAAAIVGTFCLKAYAELDAGAAEKFIKDTTSEGVEQIINADVSQAEKDKRFHKLLNNALDLDFIGQFVLGRNWKTATPQQRDQFVTTYRDLNILNWSKRFNEFKGKNFVFKGTTPSTSKGQIFVNTVVPMDQGEPAKVLWRVREKNGTYKIVDIVIEGVSIAQASRSEYTAFIKNNPGGLDALIRDLKDKLKKAQTSK